MLIICLVENVSSLRMWCRVFVKDLGFFPSYPAEKFAPKKWGLSGSSQLALVAILGGTSYLFSQGIDIRTNLAAIVALAFVDSTFLGGCCLAQITSYWPPNRRRILVHEAGHLLIGKHLMKISLLDKTKCELWFLFECWIWSTYSFIETLDSYANNGFCQYCSIPNGLPSSWSHLRPSCCSSNGHSRAGICLVWTFTLFFSLVCLTTLWESATELGCMLIDSMRSVYISELYLLYH